MIYDCFTFFSELDLLEIRLHELSDVVDIFMLSEATRTHSGLSKPLYYDENREMFAEFNDRIVHVVVDDMPMTHEEIMKSKIQDVSWLESNYQVEDNWVRERHQRNAIMRALTGCDPEDVIMISDVDEIPRASTIVSILSNLCPGSTALHQSLNTYFINWQCTNMDWYGTKILRRRDISTLSQDRFHTRATCYIENGGWHFGYVGGLDRIKSKIKAYAHQEFNLSEILDGIESRINNRLDGIGRQYRYEIIPVNESTIPKYILENLEKFDYLIYKE